MSRNTPQQQQQQRRPTTTPLEVGDRRGSASSLGSLSLDLSEEGGYSDVDGLSDSEDDDEEDVVAAEEEHILLDELERTVRGSPRPDEEDEQGDDEAEDDEADDEDEDEDEVDEHDENQNGDGIEESTSWEGLDSDADGNADDEQVTFREDSTSVTRRVRFDVPDSTDDDSTETDEDLVTHDDLFPDLFVSKRSLDPAFRREIEQDHETYDSSNSDAFWDTYGLANDFETILDPGTDFDAFMNAMEDDDSTPIATPVTHRELLTALSSAVPTPVASPPKDESSLDGYQTDGDTTDEEEPPSKLLRRKTRREPAGEESSDSDDVTLIQPSRGMPRVGRFSLDKCSKKPIAYIDKRTRKMLIFTHQNASGGGFDLSPEQFNFNLFNPPESSPILGNPGNIMMSGMISSSTYGDFMNTHAVGPAEAWYSQASGSNAIEDSDESDDGDGAIDEEEVNLKLEDFITLNSDDSSDDEDKAAEDEDQGDDIFQTPARPTTSSSDVAELLNHFENDGNIVGAFRRDQSNHQLITRNKATRESLAFSGPYYEGTLRGIKDGRIATTNVPISPMRRQKQPMPEISSSPLSSVSQKRKAPSENHLGHKRQRSVPDVQPLPI